jgi:beta-glucosidase
MRILATMAELRFPDGFTWGVATSSYQIEGAVAEDGRGPSIWDTFSHTPGRTANGEHGDVACDHYHRYPEDVTLMADLGVSAYRFSIAWPRVQPTGSGPANAKGLDFYSRLVDELLGRGIEPCPTLYHWDLPQPLEDAGGWESRDTAERFAEYAGLVAERLGDRVDTWFTHNEPVITAFYGYALGIHAPGKSLLLDVFPVVHHLLTSHGMAVQAMRPHLREGARTGIAHNLGLGRPAGTAPADEAAARALTGLLVHLYTDPAFGGGYPAEVLDLLPAAGQAAIRDGDAALAALGHDFLGVNYYSPQYVRAPSPGNPLPFDLAEPPAGMPRSQMGWAVQPAGFTELLLHLKERYGDALPPIYITENGTASPDAPGPDGAVRDPDRVSYLDGHLRALRTAMDGGVDVRGYFCWSLMDNFEWSFGYDMRFGLVHVDFGTQRRVPKASYHWYRDLIAAHRT